MNTPVKQITSPVQKLFLIAAWAFILIFVGCTSQLQVATWESLHGPEAQNISSLLVDGQNPTILFAGLSNGLILKSSDQGNSWDTLSTIVEGKPVYEMVQHPDDSKKIYAGTGGGLFSTGDGGAHWIMLTPVAGANPQPVCRTILIDPWNPLQLYVGLDGHGIFKSADAGLTWTSCNNGLTDSKIAKSQTFDIDIHPVQPDIICSVISTLGVAWSTDSGVSWKLLTDKFVSGGTIPTQVALYPTDPNIICFGTATGDIYKTANGGSNWNLTYQGSGYAPVRTLVQNKYDRDLLLAGASSGILISHDFGGTWKPLETNLPHISTSVVVLPDSGGSSFFAFGQGIGLVRSTDTGAIWQRADRQLGMSSVQQILTSQRGDAAYAAVGGAVYHYDTKGGWTSVSNGLPGSDLTTLAMDGTSDSILYAATMSGVFSTTNAGSNWKPLGNAIRGTDAYFIAAHPSIPNRLFCVTDNGLLMSTDQGNSWKPTRPTNRDVDLQSMTFHPSNAGIICASTSNKGLMTTTDGGLEWEESHYGITGRNVRTVTFDPEDQRTYYAWTADGDGFRSTNRGIEWNHISPPWKVGSEVLFALDRFKPSDVTALVSRKAIYHSQNGGETWIEIPSAEIPAEVLSLHWNRTSRILYAGTRDQGVFRFSLGKAIEKPVRR